MHIHCMDRHHHSHGETGNTASAERRVRLVLAVNLVCMVAEIVAGWVYGSLALLADGWHMGSHAGALGISLFAYGFARRHADDPAFTFGTGKVGALAGFAGAVMLVMVAIIMIWEAVERLITPVAVSYAEAMAVAVIGLVVNLAGVLILRDKDDHHHHDHGHGHEHDHNLRSAMLHIMADMLTSVGAIAALAAGMAASWGWMDPVMGMVGAVVILIWARGLLRDTSRILLDEAEDPALTERIKTLIEADADNRVADLHVWAMRPGRLAAIVSVVTHYPRAAGHYKALLAGVPGLGHVTVEVIAEAGEPCLPVTGL